MYLLVLICFITLREKKKKLNWGEMLQGEITKGGISRGEMVGGTSPGGGGRELLDPYNSIDKEVKAKALRKWNNINNKKLCHIKSRIISWSTSLHRNRYWEVIIARLP